MPRLKVHSKKLEPTTRYVLAPTKAGEICGNLGSLENRIPWYIWAALALVVARLWIQPMFSSFWLDETGTALLVKGTFAEMLQRSTRWVGQPTFYMALVWPFSQLPGPREVILRFPSLIGMAIAAVFVYRIGRKLLNVESGANACLIFAALASYYASDARPYALGLMTASGAILFLIRWTQEGRWMDALAYSIFASLTVYFHFLFSVIFLAHAAYLVSRRAQRIQMAAGVAIIAALLAPLAPALLRVLAAQSGLTFISKPRLASIVLDSFPDSFYAFVVVGLLVVAILPMEARFSRPRIAPEVWLLLAWATVPVVALYLASYRTPVLLPRYFSIALPGLALSTAWVIGNIQPATARRLIVLSIVVGAILDKGGSLTKFRHSNQDWRGAMAAVRTITENDPGMVVLARSWFIESASPETFADPTQAQFLLAPQSAYPAPGIPIPLPIYADGRALDRLESIVSSGVLENRFILVSSNDDNRYQMWLRGRLGSSFSGVSLGRFGTVSVELFTHN